MVDAQVVRPPPPRHTSRRLDVGWQESRYASPLPSPEDLERYQRLLPDAPERLLSAGEREQAHRHEIESRLATIDEQAMPKFYAGQKRAHFVSALLGGGYEVVMLVAVLKGFALEGIVGAAAGIGAMVWAIRRDPGSDGQARGEEESDSDAPAGNEEPEASHAPRDDRESA